MAALLRNQPEIATWNLARLAEAMLPLFDDDVDAAIEVATALLQTFPERRASAWSTAMRTKLGLAPNDEETGDELVADLLAPRCRADGVDYTNSGRCHRCSVAANRRCSARIRNVSRTVAAEGGGEPEEMDRRNPIYVPRNHLGGGGVAAATAGDLRPFEDLLAVVVDPFTERPGLDRFAEPAPSSFAAGYRTFCGT